jgi:uncharacterized protein (TIGR00730 family)
METPTAQKRDFIKVPFENIHRKTVCIFGASWCAPGSALYEESEQLGKQLAQAGYGVVTGGYAGVMEGVVKGAVEGNPELDRIGVVVSNIFPRAPNSYLTQSIDETSLLDRIKKMIETSSYFVCMPGTLGTLTELCVIWNLAALSTLGGYECPRILCYADPWKNVIESTSKILNIPVEHLEKIAYVDNSDDVVKLLTMK